MTEAVHGGDIDGDAPDSYTTERGLAKLTGVPAEGSESLNLVLHRLATTGQGLVSTDGIAEAPEGLDLVDRGSVPLASLIKEGTAIRWLRVANGHREELELLTQLKELRAISLRGVDLTDIDLSCLKAVPHLAWLDLSGAAISPAQAAQVAACKSLRVLYLNGKETDDELVKILIELPDLSFVSLRFAAISDQSVDLVSVKWPQLRALDIYECNELTFESLEYIKRLKRLKYINIGWLAGRNEPMHDRVDALKMALPKCQILEGS